MQKILDLAIKKNEEKSTKGFYKAKNGKKYDNYMSNSLWERFLAEMEENVREQYGAGSGGELNEKGGYPPKMASYGSSSRMIYKYSKKFINNGFRFERKLPTTVGGISNMDGYIENNTRHIYIEAKCREPYGTKNSIIEKKYEKLYQAINGNPGTGLKISIEKSLVTNNKTGKSTEKMNVTFSTEKAGEITCFDIKQMLCHLAGIATEVLNNPTKKHIHFLYFCYNPRLVEIEDEKMKSKIYARYDRMTKECESIDFAKLFEEILAFLKKQKEWEATDSDVERFVKDFKFEMCDQETYEEKIK